MGDLHLVLPALYLSTLNAGILIMMQQVRLMMFSLNMVNYSMSFFLVSTCFFPVMLKSYRMVGWVVAHEILVSAQGPSVLGFWVLGLWL